MRALWLQEEVSGPHEGRIVHRAGRDTEINPELNSLDETTYHNLTTFSVLLPSAVALHFLIIGKKKIYHPPGLCEEGLVVGVSLDLDKTGKNSASRGSRGVAKIRRSGKGRAPSHPALSPSSLPHAAAFSPRPPV